MVIFMTETGTMIRNMVKETWLIITKINIMVFGKMIYLMEMVRWFILMKMFMRDHGIMVRDTVKERWLINLQNIYPNFIKIPVNLTEYMRGNGKMIKKTALEV